MATTFAILDVLMLERILSPQVTESLTRAMSPLVVVEPVVGVEGGVGVVVEEEGGETGPPDPKASYKMT